jgi:hypothetical protein
MLTAALLFCYIALQDHCGQQWAADAGAVPQPAPGSNSSQHCADTLQVRCRLSMLMRVFWQRPGSKVRVPFCDGHAVLDSICYAAYSHGCSAGHHLIKSG